MTFEVNWGYQQVYRTVVTNARRCWQAGLVTAQMVVQGELYTDIKTAEVTVALHGGVGVDTHLGVDIKAIDETHTQVKTYHALSSWSRVSAAVEKWVREPGFTECRG